MRNTHDHSVMYIKKSRT